MIYGCFMVFPKNRGGPPKWMVKIMKTPMSKWMILGGKPTIFGLTPIYHSNVVLVMPSNSSRLPHLKDSPKFSLQALWDLSVETQAAEIIQQFQGIKIFAEAWDRGKKKTRVFR